MKFARAVFIFEAIAINAGVGLLCFFAPAVFASQFHQGELPGISLEFVRWYGVLLWVLAYVMLRALPLKSDRALRPVVEALLFGDVAHFVAAVLFVRVLENVWTVPVLFMFGMTIFLAVVRTYWLFKHNKD